MRRAAALARATALLRAPELPRLATCGAQRAWSAATLSAGTTPQSRHGACVLPFALCHLRRDSTHASANEPAVSAATGLEAVLEPVARAGEVAAIAADSNALVAALQRSLEWLHVTYDLPWWLAIVSATVALRLAIAPLVVLQMRNTAKLTLARPEMERLQARMKQNAGDPDAVKVYQRELAAIWDKYDANPVKSFAPIVAQGPLFVCFFLAIKRMAVLESFQTGGALWFVDLAACDTLYLLPLLSGATFLATVELGAVDGMQGNPAANNVKWGLRALALAMVPLTAAFPQGVFVYWISSNVFSFTQTLAFKSQALRVAAGIPDTRHLAAPAAAAPRVLLANKPPAPRTG